MTCAGCGLELPAGAARGRPARFHNELLAAVTAAEAALSELRRIVVADEQLLTGADRCLQ